MNPKPYVLPDPRVKPASFLTLLYKTMKCIEFDNRSWDKEYFARCNKRTKQLLENLDGDVRAAAKCMMDLKDQFEADNTKWTIETICQYSFEWASEKQKKTDRDCLQRLVGEFSKDERIGVLKRADALGVLDKIKSLPDGEGVQSHGQPDDVVQKGITEGSK